MLILGRRPGESILIDGGIRIVVISCDKRGVRLGIEAPTSVGIVRGEIVAQIADENRRALAAAGSEWLAALPAPRRSGERPAATPPSTPPSVSPVTPRRSPAKGSKAPRLSPATGSASPAPGDGTGPDGER